MEDTMLRSIKGYELREVLGEGGYGVVYRAYQPQVGREVAVKIILPQYANHPEFIRRFESEAQLVARLEHPYIVPLYDYWREPDGAFLVMRWLRGGSLYEALQRGPLAAAALGRLIEQIGGALTVAHRRGVVHRDLKPANILLDEDGNAYLADFGIAKDLGKQVSPYQTDQTSVVGSPAYLAPEQVKAEAITPQTDIYSLGVMLYEILTGQLPFQAPTPIALMFKHINEPMPALGQMRPDLPAAVNAVIQRATAKQPAARYADVATMLAELRQSLGYTPDLITRAVGAPAAPPERTPSGRRTTYETGLIELRPLAPPSDPGLYANPYKGLRAFQEADAADFFGREALVETLLERLREPGPFARFLAVVGPSGSGKSSVVRAGLVPALKRGALPGSANWFVLELFPSADPLGALAQALLRIAVNPPNDLVGPLGLDAQGLVRVVDQVVPGGDETEVVLVIDQFEELFTLVADEAVRAHVLQLLITAVTDPYSRVRVLVTLRADFYDRPLGYSGFSALMRKRTEVVVPLSGEELRAAIVRPAERAGLRVDPELVEAIVSDVGEQPGALPLLQYALTEVVERRQGRVLTLTPYEASGGVVGAVGRRAEELYSGLDGAAQEVTRQLFLRLVTLGEGVEDTRRRVRRTEVQAAGGGAGVLDGVIGAYAEYRLLTLDHDPQTRTPTVEVAHEALIRTWGRLRGWLAASREDVRVQRRLSAAAGEWAGSGGEGSFLASGARLEQLVGWARETHLGLNAEEQAYLAASVAARDAQQAAEAARAAREARLEARTKQVLRALVGVFAVAAVVAVGLSLYAFQQRGQARANEQRALAGEELAQTNANTAATAQANAERSAAEVQTLALSQGAQAAYNQGNIDLARQLALVAAQRPNADAFAEQTLASAVYNPGTQKVLSGHPDVVNSVVYSPDETMAFSGGRNDKTGILWDLKTGTLIKRFTGHDGRIRRVAFLPDGKRVLTGSEDGTIRLWDIACATPSAQECNTPVRVFVDHAGFEVKAIALRPNHNQFIAASSDKTLKLWDIDCATPSAQECNTPVRVFAAGNGGHTLEVNDAAFTSDGARMLSSSEDTTLVLWDVESGTPIRRMQHPNNAETRGVVILPGDQQALSTGANPDIIRWDLNSGQPIDRLRGHRGTVYSVAVSADGTRVLSSGDDNTVIEWDLQRGAPITFLRGHGGYIRQAVFSADGTHALSASADKTVRVWDLDNGAEQLRLTSADQVNTISLSADTKVLATGSDDGVARLWDLASGKPTGSYNWHERDVKSVALSPDGKYLLTGGGKRDGALILTNLQTGAIERKFGFTVFGTNSIAFTPDGTRAVTGQIIPGGDDYADDPTIDPELKNISLIVWDVASGAPIYKLTDVIAAGDRHDSINTVLITPDGTQIIGATGAGAQILIWDLETGKQLRTLDLNKGGKANDIALSADGKFLVAGSTDKTFMIWEVASGKVVFNSPPQAAAVTTVALNGDGTSVAVASETEVAIWDLRSGQKVRSFLGHRREIRRLLFTAGGHELVSASADGTTRVWRVETLPEIIAWSKEHRFFPGLTCEQLQRYNLDQQGCVSESAPTP